MIKYFCDDCKQEIHYFDLIESNIGNLNIKLKYKNGNTLLLCNRCHFIWVKQALTEHYRSLKEHRRNLKRSKEFKENETKNKKE